MIGKGTAATFPGGWDNSMVLIDRRSFYTRISTDYGMFMRRERLLLGRCLFFIVIASNQSIAHIARKTGPWGSYAYFLAWTA